MSRNLTLHFEDSKGRKIAEVPLRQTPTRLTYKVLDNPGREKELYFAWYSEQDKTDEDRLHTKQFIERFEFHWNHYCDDYTPVWGLT